MADILTGTTVINLSISIWTGTAKLHRAEVDDSELPPKDLVTLGSKKLFDPAKLKRFYGIKNNAFFLCNNYGVRFLSGWLVDNSFLPELVDKLVKQRVQWDAEMNTFLQTYDAECQKWLAQNRQWENILANAMPGVAEIGKRFNFGWQVFHVLPMPTSSEGDQTLDEVQIVGSRAVQRMAKEIEEALPTYAAGKQFRASPLRRLAALSDALSFASPEVSKLTDVLNGLVNTDQFTTRAVLEKLATPEGMAEVCTPDAEVGDIMSGIVDKLFPPKDVPEPETVEQEDVAVSGIDVSGLLATAKSVLGLGMPMPERVEEKVEAVAPVNNVQQDVVHNMLGALDSGGLW